MDKIDVLPRPVAPRIRQRAARAFAVPFWAGDRELVSLLDRNFRRPADLRWVAIFAWPRFPNLTRGKYHLPIFYDSRLSTFSALGLKDFRSNECHIDDMLSYI